MEDNYHYLADAKGSNVGYQCQKCKATTIEKRTVCRCDGCKGLTFNILAEGPGGRDVIIGKWGASPSNVFRRTKTVALA